MKKVLAGLLCLCISLCFFAGCNKKDDAVEKETDLVETSMKEAETESEETTEAKTEEIVAVTEEEIVEKFYEAYDFWVRWIYGQDKDYDFMPEDDRIDFGPYLCAVKKEAPIQSVAELENEMKKHFTKGLCEKFLAATGPMDIDGRLCMYGVDVGGPYNGPENVSVEKIDNKKYCLKVDIWSYMDEEEPDLPDQYVYYVFESGNWVFENDIENEFFYCEKLPEYLSVKYAPYNSILKKYYVALYQNWDVERVSEEGLTDILRYSMGDDALNRFGFCLIDIDDDGKNELLLGEITDGEWGKVIYDIYTQKDGQAHQVALGWERNRYYLCEDEDGYIIANEGSSGAANSTNYYYHLVEGELKLEEGVITDGWASPDNPWFKTKDTDYDVSNDEAIDEETYWEIINEHTQRYTLPQYIPFQELG